MNDVEKLFKTVVGQYVWNARQYRGSVDLEFGQPHLKVFRPRIPTTDMSEIVKQRFARRKVRPYGHWSLGSGISNWEAEAEESHFDKSDPPERQNSGLEILSGQILSSVTFEQAAMRTTFRFDQGAVLRIEPTPDMADDEDLIAIWRLHIYQGEGRQDLAISLEQDGRLITDDGKDYRPE